MFDIKIVLAIIASLLTIVGYFPYFKDIFKRKTRPHLFTWLIWAVTQGTATVAILYGGGKFAAMSTIVGTLLVLAICLLALKYGTKNITKSDTGVLLLAILAIIIWWQLKNPVLAVLMISAIDGIGYLPTFRKTYEEPGSETISFWACMALADVVTIMASAEYNVLTVTYIAVLTVANLAMVALIIWRRRAKFQRLKS
jgi:hypothetical protein